MLAALLSALAMSATMWMIARHEADASLPRVFLIAFVVALLTGISSFLLGIFALVLGFGLAAWAVRQFCYLRWPHACVVATVFIVVQFGAALLLHR